MVECGCFSVEEYRVEVGESLWIVLRVSILLYVSAM
jgi:hypothetical protein